MWPGIDLDSSNSDPGNESALQGIALRRCTPEDLPFLETLYASTREAELARTGWPEARCRQFVEQQFALQHSYYQTHFAEAQFLLLHRNGQAIGRLYWWEGAHRAVLVDVILLPQERGRGVGSALLRLLVDRAESRGLDIELHVETNNPALRLYRRFGFETLGDNGIHAKLRRCCPQATC